MARTAPRPRSVFRPRTAKAEPPPAPAPPGQGPASAAKPRKRTRHNTRETPNAPTAQPTSKKPAAREPKPKKPATPRTRAAAGQGARPLPLPLRLLAMTCAFVVMVAFAAVLARLTLEPSPASEALVHSNLRPGSSLRAYLDQPALRDAVKQVGGNVLLGVPFGVLVPVVAPRARGLLQVLLLTASVMLLVEFAQGALVTGRAFDIDDVILNTTGALIGYLLLGRRVSRAVHARGQR